MSGGIVFSVATGAKESAVFGMVQDPMKALIIRDNEAWMNNEQNLVDKIFKPFRLDTATGSIQEMGNLGEMEMVGENGGYPRSEIEEGFKKIFFAEEWKKEVAISQTAMEDQVSNALTEKARELMDAYHRTRNSFFWGLLGSALQNKHYLRKGKTISVDTMDGVKLFSTAHPSKFDPKLKQSNAFSNAFSAGALGKVSTELQNVRTDNGEIAGLIPDTIIIPNTEEAKREVFGAVGSYHNPDEQASNKFNYLFGNWNVMVVPWLVPFCTAGQPFPWIVMASAFNEKRYGAVDIRRVDPSIKSYIDEGTDANIWAMRTRFSGAFGNWRAFAAGGLPFGKEI
ncbi:MAG: hypothetical protein J6K89_07800 [Oscillospiraceae bacterium]|nr:hypothetical protein [Oscillospiraceae bacterium]